MSECVRMHASVNVCVSAFMHMLRVCACMHTFFHIKESILDCDYLCVDYLCVDY